MIELGTGAKQALLVTTEPNPQLHEKSILDKMNEHYMINH
jgi:hypothetical protein